MKENNVTTAFITHSVDEALYLGSKIVVFSAAPGRILEVDNPCFRLDNLRFRDEYYDMCMQLRKILNKGWALGAGKHKWKGAIYSLVLVIIWQALSWVLSCPLYHRPGRS